MKEQGARLQSIERLYRSRHAHFVQVARAVVGNEASAHDAVQDGFAQAIRRRDSYRGEGSLEAWLWRMVLNSALGIRRRGSFDPFELAPEQKAAEPPDEDEQVRSWVATLPERQKLAVFLRYYADLDYRAIASALEIEVGTVSATLSAALATLRRAVDTHEEVSS